MFGSLKNVSERICAWKLDETSLMSENAFSLFKFAYTILSAWIHWISFTITLLAHFVYARRSFKMWETVLAWEHEQASSKMIGLFFLGTYALIFHIACEVFVSVWTAPRLVSGKRKFPLRCRNSNFGWATKISIRCALRALIMAKNRTGQQLPFLFLCIPMYIQVFMELTILVMQKKITRWKKTNSRDFSGLLVLLKCPIRWKRRQVGRQAVIVR